MDPVAPALHQLPRENLIDIKRNVDILFLLHLADIEFSRSEWGTDHDLSGLIVTGAGITGTVRNGTDLSYKRLSSRP
jgi:hypothetical protein